MVCPPLIVNTDQITEIIEKLAASLDDLAAKLGLPTD
jgi:adenosylmethionine-8-amino-7-oxononanoate aminotransferase